MKFCNVIGIMCRCMHYIFQKNYRCKSKFHYKFLPNQIDKQTDELSKIKHANTGPV